MCRFFDLKFIMHVHGGPIIFIATQHQIFLKYMGTLLVHIPSLTGICY